MSVAPEPVLAPTAARESAFASDAAKVAAEAAALPEGERFEDLLKARAQRLGEARMQEVRDRRASQARLSRIFQARMRVRSSWASGRVRVSLPDLPLAGAAGGAGGDGAASFASRLEADPFQTSRSQRVRGGLLDRFGAPAAFGFDTLMNWMAQRNTARGRALNFFDQLGLDNLPLARDGVMAMVGMRMQVQTVAARLGAGPVDGPDLTEVTDFNAAPDATVGAFRIDLSVQVTQQAQARPGDAAMQLALSGGAFNVSAMLQMFDPLILDLEGDGIDMKGAEEGVEFDLHGDGEAERTGFIQGDDALLYLDEDGDGVATNGMELFGDQHGASNGFDELAFHDANQDGRIDGFDDVFDRLRLFVDRDGDGVNQRRESLTLREAGISAIDLDYRDVDRTDEHGNRITQVGGFRRADGGRGTIVDAHFGYFA